MSAAYHEVVAKLGEKTGARFITHHLEESEWLFTGSFTGLRFESVVSVEAGSPKEADQVKNFLIREAGEIDFKLEEEFVASLVVERHGPYLKFDLVTADAT